MSALPDHAILQQAAHWFAALSDEDATDDDRNQWQRWLNAAPQHRLAWHYVERVGQRFQQAQQQAGSEGADRILKATRNERLARRRVVGSGLAGLALWLGWRHTPLPAISQQIAASLTADHHTATGETRQLTLADGGQLWLNTATAVDIHYRDNIRQVDLRNGEILIETAKDPQQRPFIVNTRQGQLRALGTRFTVQQNDNGTLLAVYDGAVEIKTTQGHSQTVTAGEQTTFTHSAIVPPSTAQRARETWSKGLIIADNIPLKALIAELARYRRGHLGLDSAVAELKVIGTYPIDNPDHALAMLENALPVTVNRILPWWVTLEPLK